MSAADTVGVLRLPGEAFQYLVHSFVQHLLAESTDDKGDVWDLLHWVVDSHGENFPDYSCGL